jgi:hypothetical protein
MKRLLLFLLQALLIPTGVASAQLVVAPTTSECATSIDGSVVGVPNPLQPPQISPVYSGTLPAGNYFTEFAWYDAASHVTLVSPEVQTQLSATGQLQISPPSNGMPATAAGMQVYIATSSGAETLQGTTTGSNTYIQSTALTTGAAIPGTNTTVCQLIANDAGWPTGTGYQVSLTTPAGNTYPGYPMQWQLLGPGGTINVGNGLPLYNGVVQYPVPILSYPYGHGPQSINGPLSLTNYNLFNVGRVGVGTPTPGWGIDLEGSGLNGMANAVGGYLVNGVAPAPNTCLGSTDGIANDVQIPCLTGVTTYYQTVEANGTAETQRSALNFSTSFTLADSSSPSRTNVSLANTGVTATSYTYPSSITVNPQGQITAITAGSRVGVNYGILASGVCSTSNAANATCTSTVTLSTTEPDTNYAVSCSGVGTITGFPYIAGVAKNTGSVAVTISNGQGSAAEVSTYSEIDCTIVGT